MNEKPIPWWVVPSIAYMVLAIFAMAIGLACWLGDKTLITTLLTGAYGLANLAAGYYFGSSNGSQKKDSTLAALSTPSNGANP